MSDIARFSTQNGYLITRFFVSQDACGQYHIDQEIWKEVSLQSGGTDIVLSEERRRGIHGAMDAEAYARWLSNLLFNKCFHVASIREQQWMLFADKLSK